MSDLISRQAAIDAIYGLSDDSIAWLDGAAEAVKELPSAQPEPLTVTIDYEPSKDVYDRLKQAMRDAPILLLPSEQPERKKGKWLWELADNGWANHICSKCGWTKNTDIHVSLGYSFCPNCGAEMSE